MVSSTSIRSLRRIDAALILGLVLVAAVIPLLTSAFAGSLEIPRNDDWSYRRIAQVFADTGRLEMDGAAETTLIGQILLTQPLVWLSSGQPLGFAVAGFLFAITAAIGAYALARQLLPPRRAIVAALMLPLFPGYLAYATSYMNDVPALAAQFGCVALGAFAISRRPLSFGWLVVAVGVGCLAFSIRNFGLAAPVAVLTGALFAQPRRPRNWVLSVGAAGVCVGIQMFRSSLPGQLGHVGLDIGFAAQIPTALVTVALVALPACLVAIAISGRYWRRRDIGLGLIVGLIVVALHVARWVRLGTFPQALMRNLVTQQGAPDAGYVLGQRPVLFDESAWAALNLIALASVVVVAGAAFGVMGMYARSSAGSSWRRLAWAGTPQGVVAVFTLLAAGGLALVSLVLPVFDRYLWPILPPLAAILMADPPAGSRAVETPSHWAWMTGAAAIADVGLLAIVAGIFMTNTNAFDAARWTAGDRLVSAGISANQIDAGYEWVGFHATQTPDPTAPEPGPIWYRGWWRGFEACGVASSGPVDLEDGVLVGKVPYRLELVVGPVVELWLYKIESSACEFAG